MSELLDKFLEERGLTFEQMKDEERALYMKWVNALSQKELTIEEVQGFIRNLITAVENELANSDITSYGIFGIFFYWRKNKDLFLKARLKNLILLEAMLSGPARAKK